MLWTVKGVDDTNHQPQACVAQGLDITRRPGQPVVLTPRARDVDGDAVTLTWWQYREAGTYPGTVELETTGAGTARFRVPADAQPGQTIHLILEATDDGSPALTHYQRVVVTVADQRDAVGRSGPGGCAQN
ncbi:cadherin repeat domain-containing protein [Jiangella gansuensis]|uniref:cadherin repeat domain-containing protein n=1 Tax=Jiangella gansuensis TaxID=281473 RepID=UPI00047B210F|nr:cadherin repeat domain-containing protein [Jiangella gansuensis]